MTRLIDADLLKRNTCDGGACSDCDNFWNGGKNVQTNCSEIRWYFLNVINKQPTVDAEPVRHGRWIYLDKDNKFFKKHIVKCSLCNNSLDLYAVNGGRGDANYCPNCGAIMEKPE